MCSVFSFAERICRSATLGSYFNGKLVSASLVIIRGLLSSLGHLHQMACWLLLGQCCSLEERVNKMLQMLIHLEQCETT